LLRPTFTGQTRKKHQTSGTIRRFMLDIWRVTEIGLVNHGLTGLPWLRKVQGLLFHIGVIIDILIADDQGITVQSGFQRLEIGRVA
jgi:hypothetical protein